MQLKPFDIEAAKAGKPVMMENGTLIHRFLCFDRKYPGYPIVATYIGKDGVEHTETFTVDGKIDIQPICWPGKNLVMVPEEGQKVTRFVNVFSDLSGKRFPGPELYYSVYEANESISGVSNYVGTYPVEITF